MNAQKPQKMEMSLKERDRRYSVLREKLKEEGLDGIIVSGAALYALGSPIHYLTQIWGSVEVANAVVFPVDGDLVLMVPGLPGAPPSRTTPWVPAENIVSTPNLGEEIARQIIRLKLHNSRIGVDSFDVWPVNQYKTVTELCPKVQLVEARQLFSKIRARKSSEELVFMEEARRVEELAQRTFLSNLRAGLTELQIVSKVEEVMTANGVAKHQFIFVIESKPEDGGIHWFGNLPISKSIALSFSPEFAMTQGYACQVQRMYCWEEPKGEYKRMFDLCAEMRRMTERELRPGIEINRFGKMIVDLIEEWGCQLSLRSIGHAIGIHYGEDPYICTGPNQPRYEEWIVSPDEVYVVHPMITAKGGKEMLAWLGDMYLVKEDHTEWMTPFLPGLPEIIP
jgi:Xaa-Pro aminopeptidase